ncbi:MAG: hypothetical protein ABII82_01045, partial [Verrucomicrobiota bacterium]
ADLTYGSISRSVVKWGNQYYWSDNATGELGSTLGHFGVDPPANQPTVLLGRRGTLFLGEYRYCVRFVTGDGWRSASGTVDDRMFTAVNAAEETVKILGPGDYPDFDTYHTTGGLGYPYYAANSRVNYLGHSWRAIEGIAWKSAGFPIPPSGYPGTSPYWQMLPDTESIESYGYADMIVELPQPTQTVVDRIEIYRTTANGSVFYLIATVPAGTSQYNDTTDDVTALTKETYDLSLTMPPVYVRYHGSWEQVGGKFLLECDGRFYVAVGDRMYESEQGNPHAWDPRRYIGVEGTITNQMTDGTVVLVFTTNQTYRFTPGATVLEAELENLKVDQGCPNWRTGVYFGNQPAWMSHDGLCGYSNMPTREGRYVQVLTEGRYRFAAQPDFAVSANDVYWAFYEDDGVAVRIDFRAGMRVSRYSIIATEAYYDRASDRLLVKSAGRWRTAEAGTARSWSYTSPEIDAGDANAMKLLTRLRVDATAAVELDIYLDGELAHSESVTAKLLDTWLRFPAGTRGRRVQFAASGSGTLRSLAVDFTPKVRGA